MESDEELIMISMLLDEEEEEEEEEIGVTSYAPVGKVAASIKLVGITDRPMRAIRPVPVSGCACIRFYTKAGLHKD